MQLTKDRQKEACSAVFPATFLLKKCIIPYRKAGDWKLTKDAQQEACSAVFPAT